MCIAPGVAGWRHRHRSSLQCVLLQGCTCQAWDVLRKTLPPLPLPLPLLHRVRSGEDSGQAV